MITISKPEHGFLRRHWKSETGLLGLAFLIVGGIISLAYAEGVYYDPEGQLNNLFSLACLSGILVDRSVDIIADGEYNWMFAKGQEVSFKLSAPPSSLGNNSLRMIFFSWSLQHVLKDDVLRTGTTVDWTITIPQSGHWQLELVTLSGNPITIIIHIVASSSGSIDLLNCLNPGDLFRRDT